MTNISFRLAAAIAPGLDGARSRAHDYSMLCVFPGRP
jgi:hypothetical protein